MRRIGKVIELVEQRSCRLPPSELPGSAAELLWRRYGDKVTVEYPSPGTDGCWQLTALNWIGHIPLGPDLAISIQPKVPLHSIFSMLEYAFDLRSFAVLGGLYQAQSMTDLYERLADVLARSVLRRAQLGLAKAYVGETDRLLTVRGRLNVLDRAVRPWSVALECAYEEHIADIEDNRILAWTLNTIARSGITRPGRALDSVTAAYRRLIGTVTCSPVSAAACVGHRYNRLNADYERLHALCRFFLEHSGPHHELGDHAMLPWLVDTARLFETCVASWLKAHLPTNFRVVAQQRYSIDRPANLAFTIDLVISDRETGAVLSVLDTKYKRPGAPSADDVAQVVAYASALGSNLAYLVYPTQLQRSLNTQIGDIRVRSVVFDIGVGIEQAGAELIHQTLAI